MDHAKVSVIVLNYNGLDDTVECLRSLKNVRYPNYEMVVVDNASTDGSTEAIARLFPDIALIKNTENMGYAEGNNIGIRYALNHDSDYIFLLNNDTVVNPQILNNFVHAANIHTEAGIFGAKIYYYSKPNQIWFAGGELWNDKDMNFVPFGHNARDNNNTYNAVKEIDYATGCSLFFRKAVVDTIGLLDSAFFLTYEEIDFCFRAKKAGFKCLFIPDAEIWHKISVSLGGQASPASCYYNIRNRMLWLKKNFSYLKRFQGYKKAIGTIFFPHIYNSKNFYLLKRIYWDLLGYTRIWKNPQLKAKIYGIIDFALGRFGECPQKIYDLQQEYKIQKPSQ